MSDCSAKSPPERVITPEGTTNFRDVGGYTGYSEKKVAWRTLFRSDSLHGLTEDGVQTFLELGIRTVVDLRGDRTPEHENVPGVVSVIKIIHLPWDTTGAVSDDVRQSYRNYVHDNVSLFREVFLLLAETRNLPLLFHCAAGKDRTGILAAVILKSLGVANEIVYADYILTGDLNPDWGLDQGDIMAAVDEIERAGGIERFLLERVGIDRSTLEAVRDNLMI